MHFSHFHFDFSARQILWTLTFASQLVLLVVLLGRDRMRRYPWFTASIALYALILMTEELLSGRMAPLLLQEIMLALRVLSVLVALMVLAEMAWHAFAGAPRPLWIANTAGLGLVAVGVLYLWGPWPVWKEIAPDSLLGKLRLTQLVAQKGEILVYLLTVGLGLLVVLFGRRFKTGWRSHTQMIAIGLSTAAISSLAMRVIFDRLQATVQAIIKMAQPNARQEYAHIVSLATKLGNAHEVIYVAALVWWIVWLWPDEPGTVIALQEETPRTAE
jgi:hypothetical protein